MRIHKEGRSTIIIVIMAIVVFLTVIISFSLYNIWIQTLFVLLSLLVLAQTLMFFRVPNRNIQFRDDGIVAPADGRIVMVQEVMVNEFIQEKRLQVSIFMNLFNVHVNWYPCGGKIIYYKYHPGDKMVAWHPKSSDKNEHTTMFLYQGKHHIGVRQIAGLMARRVICKARMGKQVLQGSDMGIIKFGSRLDILLPLDAEVVVKKGQMVWDAP